MNTKQIRDVAFVAHRYIGLAIGLLAAAIGLTGSLLIIHSWIGEGSNPSVIATGARLPIEKLIAIAQAKLPDEPFVLFNLPESTTAAIQAVWANESKEMSAYLNPYTGEMLSSIKHGDVFVDSLWKIHIQLLGGEWGGYIAGIVGLLATILCLTGIVLWPGWRKLSTGFKIKWNAKQKRLNFDLHKVAGIVAAVFLTMAMATGFIWNFGTWTEPLIYAVTFSSKSEPAVSKPQPGKSPLILTDALLQKASAAMPPGTINRIRLANNPEEVIQIEKQLAPDVVATASIDRYSGEIVKIEGLPTEQKSLGQRIYDSFLPVHVGSFAGIYSRIFYVFVGLSPTILLVTGFIMWQNRRRVVKPKSRGAAVES
jgi:uncharacterized iron-regulated membrane protein